GIRDRTVTGVQTCALPILGTLARMRALAAIEEHGQGKQLIRLRCVARWPWLGLALVLILSAAATGALVDGVPLLGVALAVLGGRSEERRVGKGRGGRLGAC